VAAVLVLNTPDDGRLRPKNVEWLCRNKTCVVLHQVGVSFDSALIRRCDDLPATITHVPVAAVLVLNTPDDGSLHPKHVEWLCRNRICAVLHQVGVSFDLYYDARKHKIKNCCMLLILIARDDIQLCFWNPVTVFTWIQDDSSLRWAPNKKHLPSGNVFIQI